jgi:CRISPR-associated protein Cmr4
VLEEFSFTAKQSDQVNEIAEWLMGCFPEGAEYTYWREKVKNSLIILPADAFRDFVVNSTEVTTRVRILPDSKTVQDRALWTQESLPADTLMVSAVTARRLRVSNGNRSSYFQTGSSEEVLNWLMNLEKLPSRIQIGGDETTGAGQVALRWL